ncbi:MAG: hypothetical protein VX438_15400, partial [Planctomycetota bacterium]|nr:hypothetical protein [Planctomycetota bacterium]
MIYTDPKFDQIPGNRVRNTILLGGVGLGWLIFCGLGVGCPAISEGQERVTLTQEQWETGFQAFAQVLRKKGVQIVGDFEAFRQYPEEQSILILLGGISAEDETWLGRFVLNGGSALLATDANFGPVRIDRHVVKIGGEGSVRANNGQDQYQKNPGWPIVRSLKKDNALFDGVDQIVPNLAAYLSVNPRMNAQKGWSTLARYPGLVNYGYGQPFVVQHQNQLGGQLLIVADHSVYV